MKKIIIIIMFLLLTGCNLNKEVIDDNELEINEEIEKEPEVEVNTGYIIDTIEIKDIDGKKVNYEFIYNTEKYNAMFVNDTWKIYDSYKITNSNDIKKICEALIEIHKIPSKDYKSYRNAEDMAYEWLQHNLAYTILLDGNSFRNSAKDVDLDPKDQGKSLVEIYEDRTGQKLDLTKFFK